MPKTEPLPDWNGQDAYVIGGGHSLKDFDFGQLLPLNTIGCNQAFRLGGEACKVCIFGDFKFWHVFRQEIAECFTGWVATCYRTDTCPAWLKAFARKTEGLATGNTLGWNFNTGSSAINLALTMGAKRVFLLGFDCKMGPTPDESHWHNAAIETPMPANYEKFMAGFSNVAKALPEVFPGREIIVVGAESKLECFPRFTFAEAGLVAPNITGVSLAAELLK